MPVRARKRVVTVQYRPAMPGDLVSYHPGEWGAPRWDGRSSEWEAGHRAAYQRWLQAQTNWRDAHKHMPVDPASAPVGDEVWCSEFEPHTCLGADCPRRPAERAVADADDQGDDDQ